MRLSETIIYYSQIGCMIAFAILFIALVVTGIQGHIAHKKIDEKYKDIDWAHINLPIPHGNSKKRYIYRSDHVRMVHPFPSIVEHKCLVCGEPSICFSGIAKFIVIQICTPSDDPNNRLVLHKWRFGEAGAIPLGYEWVQCYLYCRTHFEARASRSRDGLSLWLVVDAPLPPPLWSRIWSALKNTEFGL